MIDIEDTMNVIVNAQPADVLAIRNPELGVGQSSAAGNTVLFRATPATPPAQ